MAIIRRRDVGPSGVEPTGEWNPFEMMRDLMTWEPFREFTRATPAGVEFVPSLEVKERKDAIVLRADLPGVREDDVDVSLTGNRLTISGKREEEKKEEGERYYTYERSYGTFSRSFTLPEGIDSEHIEANLKDGVLDVTIPKRPEVQPKKISLLKSGRSEKLKA
ncbi:MAG: Hsp20/alpha crystallin family protein [Myxococcaceae bacterium]